MKAKENKETTDKADKSELYVDVDLFVEEALEDFKKEQKKDISRKYNRIYIALKRNYKDSTLISDFEFKMRGLLAVDIYLQVFLTLYNVYWKIKKRKTILRKINISTRILSSLIKLCYIFNTNYIDISRKDVRIVLGYLFGTFTKTGIKKPAEIRKQLQPYIDLKFLFYVDKEQKIVRISKKLFNFEKKELRINLILETEELLKKLSIDNFLLHDPETSIAKYRQSKKEPKTEESKKT